MTEWPSHEDCKDECWFAPTLRALKAQVKDDEAEIDRLTAARDTAIKALCEAAKAKGQAEGKLAASEMAGVIDGWKNRAEKAEAERDQALARAAAAAMEMRDRASDYVQSHNQSGVTYNWSGMAETIRAIPINPDAEAALKRAVDAAVLVERQACADACLPHQDDDGMDRQAKAECRAAILARPTEGEQDV